jgi:hypothetical protein
MGRKLKHLCKRGRVIYKKKNKCKNTVWRKDPGRSLCKLHFNEINSICTTHCCKNKKQIGSEFCDKHVLEIRFCGNEACDRAFETSAFKTRSYCCRDCYDDSVKNPEYSDSYLKNITTLIKNNPFEFGSITCVNDFVGVYKLYQDASKFKQTYETKFSGGRASRKALIPLDLCHFIPNSLGGINAPRNIIIAPKHINQRLSDKMFYKYSERTKGYIPSYEITQDGVFLSNGLGVKIPHYHIEKTPSKVIPLKNSLIQEVEERFGRDTVRSSINPQATLDKLKKADYLSLDWKLQSKIEFPLANLFIQERNRLNSCGSLTFSVADKYIKELIKIESNLKNKSLIELLSPLLFEVTLRGLSWPNANVIIASSVKFIGHKRTIERSIVVTGLLDWTLIALGKLKKEIYDYQYVVDTYKKCNEHYNDEVINNSGIRDLIREQDKKKAIRKASERKAKRAPVTNTVSL